MQESLTVKDAVRFLREEPKLLKEWNVKDIYRAIYCAISDGTLFWTRDSSQRLCGLAIGILSEDKTILHVCAIKCKQEGLLRLYIRELWRRFPNLKKVTAQRHNKKVEYYG